MSRYTQPQRQPLQLSDEETKAMKSCLDKSFWTYSVPCSVSAFIGLKFLATKGFKPGMFTYAFTVLGSTIFGRVLAIPQCMKDVQEKYPDGQLAQILREAREGKIKQGFDEFVPPTVESDPNDQIPVINDDEKSAALNKQTYDDLRRRNREQYLSNMRKPTPEASRSQDIMLPPLDQPSSSSVYSDYSDPPPPYYDHPFPSSSSAVDEEPQSQPRRRKRVNKYGDEIEE